MSSISLLRLAETNALAMSPQLELSDGNSSSASDNGFSYTGSGKSANDPKKSKFNLSGFRKKLATIALVGLLGGATFILGSTNSGLIPAINTNFNNALNTMNSEDSRYPFLTAYWLTHKNTTNAILKPYETMSNTFKTRLIKNGFEVNTDGGTKTLTFNGKTVTNNAELTNLYKTDPDFRKSYNNARHSNIANFFDESSNRFFKTFGFNRNKYSDFEQTNDATKNMDAYREKNVSEYDNNQARLKGIEDIEVADTDEDGNIIYKKNEAGEFETDSAGNRIPQTHTETVDTEISSSRSNLTDVDARAKATSTIGSMSAKAASIASVGNGACAMMRLGSALSNMISATTMLNAIKIFSQSESISKAMVDGEANQSGINEFLNILTTPTTTTVSALEKVNSTNTEDVEIEESGAPIEANGMQTILGGAPVNPLTTKRYSLIRAIGPIAAALSLSRASMSTCLKVESGYAVVSIATTIATLGVSTIGQVLLNVGLTTAVTGVAATALNFLIPTVAKALDSNAFDNLAGKPLGEYYAMGGSLTYAKNAQMGSGQTYSSEASALASNRVRRETLALEAEIDRRERSPFDISSPNTFLGSIASKLSTSTLATSGKSTVHLAGLSALSRTTASSLTSIATNNTYAAGVGSDYLVSFGDCPEYAENGLVGDMYCVPIMSTDPTTLQIEPDNDKYLDVISESLDCDGDSCSINPKSDLARYVTYCTNRQSLPGVIDQNILGAEESGNLVLNNIPIVGDVITLLNNSHSEEKLDWASGKKCYKDEKNPDEWNNKFRYYQRYVSDQRILDQFGAYEGEKNPVTALIDNYEAAHPFSNTYTGQIARLSGLTEDYTEAAIAYVNYHLYLQNYDPNTRIAMDGTASDPKTSTVALNEIKHDHLHFHDQSDHPETATFVAYTPIVYSDLRNRSQTSC